MYEREATTLFLQSISHSLDTEQTKTAQRDLSSMKTCLKTNDEDLLKFHHNISVVQRGDVGGSRDPSRRPSSHIFRSNGIPERSMFDQQLQENDPQSILLITGYLRRYESFLFQDVPFPDV